MDIIPLTITALLLLCVLQGIWSLRRKPVTHSSTPDSDLEILRQAIAERVCHLLALEGIPHCQPTAAGVLPPPDGGWYCPFYLGVDVGNQIRLDFYFPVAEFVARNLKQEGHDKSLNWVHVNIEKRHS